MNKISYVVLAMWLAILVFAGVFWGVLGYVAWHLSKAW